jgi:hypothetical protein
MIHKNCIFCGNPPVSKNKEHILPKWLLSLTGSENRQVPVGYNWKTQEPIKFDFSSFVFPSCKRCNSEFSDIEAKLRPIFDKLLLDDYLNPIELCLLLDWFDKIRIGLWLAVSYLNKETFGVTPRFYIKDRIATKDRLLTITNLYNSHIGLSWIGANSLCFIYSPTCLSLQINNLLFVNASLEFLVSEHLGFPYPILAELKSDHGKTDYVMAEAKEQYTKQLFRTVLSEPHIKIMQPIYNQNKEFLPSYYDTQYIQQNSYDPKKGIGKIFLEHDNMIYPVAAHEEVNFSMKEKIWQGRKVPIIGPTLLLQMELLTKYPVDTKRLTVDQKVNYEKVKKEILNYTKLQYRSYKD